MTRSINKMIFYVAAVAIAMGFMESAVVIYLREIFYPSGFRFPLIPIPHRLAIVEIIREAATVIILVGIGFLAGRNKVQRFAFFSLAFAVWDLCYYIFLYVFLRWPESLFTWDILFLIPLPWVGPVWAPCLISLLMLAGSLFVIIQTESNKSYRIRKAEWISVIAGALICIASFMLDFLRTTGSALKSSALSSGDLFTDVRNYVPQEFDHAVFFSGFALMLGGVLSNIFFTNKKINHEKE
jgi:hypothetical protein